MNIVGAHYGDKLKEKRQKIYRERESASFWVLESGAKSLKITLLFVNYEKWNHSNPRGLLQAMLIDRQVRMPEDGLGVKGGTYPSPYNPWFRFSPKPIWTKQCWGSHESDHCLRVEGLKIVYNLIFSNHCLLFWTPLTFSATGRCPLWTSHVNLFNRWHGFSVSFCKQHLKPNGPLQPREFQALDRHLELVSQHWCQWSPSPFLYSLPHSLVPPRLLANEC